MSQHLMMVTVGGCVAFMIASGQARAQTAVTTEDRQLLAWDGESGDIFGISIATDAGMVAVGASQDDDAAPDAGAVYLFDALSGAPAGKLLPNDGVDGVAFQDAWFGESVAIDGDAVVVGAPGYTEQGYQYGAAFLFGIATGTQIAPLVPTHRNSADSFGHAVAVGGGFAVVGAAGLNENGADAGAAFVFDTATGGQLHKLLPDDAWPGDRFGSSVSIDGGTVAVGANKDADLGTSAGSAYLFDASTGQQLRKLLPDDGEVYDEFGYSVAISGELVAVGSPGDDDYGGASGSVYVFDAATGAQLRKLTPSDGQRLDRFGFSVALRGGVLIVGARGDADNGTNAGSAYLFNATNGLQLGKYLASDGAGDDGFGWSVGLADGKAVIGAYGSDANGNEAGSAYLFPSLATGCPADFNGDGVLDNGDISAFIAYFLGTDLAADLNGDGLLDSGDIGAFVAAYLDGC